MENRAGNSYGAEIPKKPRSLDLKSVYESSKGAKGAQNRNLKRNCSSINGGFGGNKSKKSRKAVPISSFNSKPVNNSNGSSKSLEEMYNGCLNPHFHDLKELKSASSGRLADGSSVFSGISLVLEDSVVKVPRRKRGFVGRKKVDNGSQVVKLKAESDGKVGIGDELNKVNVEEKSKPIRTVKKVKREKGFDEFKENRSGELNSGWDLKEEKGCAAYSDVNNNHESLQSLHTDHVAENGDPSLQKLVKKLNKKRKDLVHDRKKEAEHSIDTSVNVIDDLQDDDEENLEENAARMLSSRFDTSCAGFSSNSKSSALPSGFPFLFSPGQELVTRRSSYVSHSESTSVDTNSRVLRPRKQHKEKGNSRKRRHYYEVLSRDLDADWVLNRRIKVFWPLDKSWYYGLVGDYDKEKKLHHVKYDDRDEEWINLKNERFKLLLLPSEVPGKIRRKRHISGEKQSDGDKRKRKSRKESRRNLTKDDDSHAGSYMESEPIISWLARSTQRVKSSLLHSMKKPKTYCQALSSVPLFLSKEAANRCECLGGGSRSSDKSKLYCNSDFLDNLATPRSEGCTMEGPNHPKDSKVPVVYYRKRFHKTRNVLCNTSEGNRISTYIPESYASSSPPVVSSGALQEHHILAGRLDPDEAMDKLDTVEVLWLIDDGWPLKLNILSIGSRQFGLALSIPMLSVLNYSFGKADFLLVRTVLLLQHGILMTMWPRVHLEMLFVDNIVGLRFLLFEGCLKQAVTFLFLVLAVFDLPAEQENCFDLQLPVTSIRFKFSCIQDFKRQLVFTFYNFSEVGNSKWMHLDRKLEKHCVLTRQLPLSECTYDNIKALQNGSKLLVSTPVFKDSVQVKVPWRRSRPCMSLMGASRESTYANPSQSCSNSDKNDRYFPPFALSFTAAPTFFLGLHLKLLMERSMSHIRFQDHESVEHPENSGSLLAAACSSMEDFSRKGLGSPPAHNLKPLDFSRKGLGSPPAHNLKPLPKDVDCGGCLPCVISETQSVDVSVCCIGDKMNSSPKSQNGDEASAGIRDPGKLGSDVVVPLQKWQCHQSEAEQCDLLPSLSVDRKKSDTGSHSSLNGVTVEIPLFDQFEKHVDKGLHGSQQSIDLAWNMNGGLIPSPNPTARRSTWHQNRSSSTSFGYLANGWSDGRVEFCQNNFGNRPKRPRTQVSYAFPYGAFDYGSKHKSHQQKGLPHKRIRVANEKRLSDVSRGSGRNFEFLSCDANMLITLGDRGWRECGVQVVLELFDHNEWKLAVKLSGTTKYSYKAHQFLQPASTNRYTHAMMWKGGKDWMLEFPDRSQWVLFKEMHEECYNRNIRAASVKNIPIPGVLSVEDNDDNGVEVPFIRSSLKYFLQVETDVEMALAPSRVLYDMDSDDELWISKNQGSLKIDNNSWEISEELFEKIMDMFEKTAYSGQSDQFTSDEIEDLMAGFGPMEAIKTIHEYWQTKRQRKGMPLIRHLQPPLWEKYQQQLREWELAVTRSSSALPNGCHGKVAPLDKPPMFAFCLKPRGLEVPNKGSKQRSQKKISVMGQSNNLSGDNDGFHPYGRRLNGFASGDEKAVHLGHNYEAFDDYPLPQVSPRVFSSREADSTGYFSLGSGIYDSNHPYKFHRSKDMKLGTYVSPMDTQVAASYNPRMLVQRNGVRRWNTGFSDWPSQWHHQIDGSMRHCPELLDGTDLDELRLRDASGAAQRALYMAKLKRERAHRLLYRADLAIHRAVVSLTTAEAIKHSSGDLNGDR